ncbi:MAG: hypothetical protein WAN12_17850 [Candidatus Acidiferrum sp.]
MRKQFVLDKRTNKLLEELASQNGGNRCLIVRQAIRVHADVVDRLEKIEADPAFQAMMARSDADIKAGRVTPHEEVVRKSRGLSGRKRKKH